MNTSLFDRVRHLFIVLGTVAVVFALPTWAQDEDEDAAELGKIEVTGSRLNQTDVETAQPVTVITREDIELTGFATVAEVLQSTPYNSFGSFRETSGYANGQASVNEISLRGLGASRTLLLKVNLGSIIGSSPGARNSAPKSRSNKAPGEYSAAFREFVPLNERPLTPGSTPSSIERNLVSPPIC